MVETELKDESQSAVKAPKRKRFKLVGLTLAVIIGVYLVASMVSPARYPRPIFLPRPPSVTVNPCENFKYTDDYVLKGHFFWQIQQHGLDHGCHFIR